MFEIKNPYWWEISASAKEDEQAMMLHMMPRLSFCVRRYPPSTPKNMVIQSSP